ncbi:BRO-N domain-containing protein (plasmid) [Cupriavidus basilensis]
MPSSVTVGKRALSVVETTPSDTDTRVGPVTQLPIGEGGAVVRGFSAADGNRWYCAADIAKLLGLSNVSSAIARHCVAHCGILLSATETSSGLQNLVYLSEYNLRRLIVCCRKPEAEAYFDRALGELVPAREAASPFPRPEPVPPAACLVSSVHPDAASRSDLKVLDRGEMPYDPDHHWDGVQRASAPASSEVAREPDFRAWYFEDISRCDRERQTRSSQAAGEGGRGNGCSPGKQDEFPSEADLERVCAAIARSRLEEEH